MIIMTRNQNVKTAVEQALDQQIIEELMGCTIPSVSDRAWMEFERHMLDEQELWRMGK